MSLTMAAPTKTYGGGLAPALPMAAMGFDSTRDGRVDTVVVGQDLNRDGIPDVLERSPVTYGGGLAPTIGGGLVGGKSFSTGAYGGGFGRVAPPQVQYIEKIVDVPQVQTVEKRIPVPQIVNQEVVKERFVTQVREVTVPVAVPQVQYVERFVDVPQLQTVEKKVQVPQVITQERQVTVPVPQIQEVRVPVAVPQVIQEVVKERFVPQIREVNVPVAVPQVQIVEKFVDVPQVQTVEKMVQVPQVITEEIVKERFVPQFREVQVPVAVPQVQTVEKKVEVPQIITKEIQVPVPVPQFQAAVGIPQVQTLDMYLQAPQIAVQEVVRQQPVIMQQPALPMAAMGFDRTRDGRVDTLVVGQDLNRDGIPDVLERSPVTYGGGLAPTIGGGLVGGKSFSTGVPMAAMGFDRTRDGRVDTMVVGQDLNRDGIPDVLERSPVTYGGGLARTIGGGLVGGGTVGTGVPMAGGVCRQQSAPAPTATGYGVSPTAGLHFETAGLHFEAARYR